ncbi:MAG: DUF305 domain-containing protein [Rubritepida sp.]|nr:DUF305 domain-containing protein [Rubritepida sp.]
MRRIVLTALALVGLSLASSASAFVADEYNPNEGPATLTWWDLRVVPRGGDAVQALGAAQRADVEYVRGMRPHHAGGVTMSRAYLADPEARNPSLRALAYAIIENQTFEVRLLDDVSRLLAEPVRTINFGLFRVAVRPVGTEGLGNQWRFLRQPIPILTYVGGEVTARDVRFAKAMIVHHEGALRMAGEFNSNPQERNTFLALMNVHILTDQTQEITLMRNVIAAYPGNPDAIEVQPGDVQGMDMPMGGPIGGSGGGHGQH